MYSSETNQFERTEHIYIRFDWYRDEINLAQSSRGIDCVRKLHSLSRSFFVEKPVNNFRGEGRKKKKFRTFRGDGIRPVFA